MAAVRSGRLLLQTLHRTRRSIFTTSNLKSTGLSRWNGQKIKILSLGENMRCHRLLSASVSPNQNEANETEPVDNEVIVRGITSKTVDAKLHTVNLFCQRTGRVLEKDVSELVNLIQNFEILTPNQALFALRCCSALLVDVQDDLRHSRYVQPLWNTIKSRDITLDASHYNMLLKAYLDNNTQFSPVDILGELASKQLEPNRLTYQLLIQKYCQDGEIDEASAILEHMKTAGLAINEQVFHSLIYGHSKLGNFEAADKVLDIMKDIGLEADHLAYVSKLRGMIVSGQSETAVLDEMANCIDKGMFFDDQDYFTLICDFCEKGNGNAAKTLVEKIPRKTGYFQVMRNNLPKIIMSGELDLALGILQTFETGHQSEEFHSKENRSDNGLFFIRVMIGTDKYSIEQVFDVIDALKKPTEHSFRLMSRLVEQYIRWGKYEEGSEFITKAKEKYGDEFLNDVMFPNNINQYISKIVRSTEGATEVLARTQEMGLPMTLEILSDGFFSCMLRNGSDRTVADITRYTSKNANVPLSRIIAALLRSALNTTNPQRFKECAALMAMMRGGSRYPNNWNGSLARAFAMSDDDVQSFVAILFYNSPMYFSVQHEDFPEVLANNGSDIERVFRALPLCYDMMKKMPHRGDADDRIDKVLQELERMKLGIPESAANELKERITNEDIVKRIDVLQKNYGMIKELWSSDEGIEFVATFRKKVLDDSPRRKSDSGAQRPRFEKGEFADDIVSLENMVVAQLKKDYVDFKALPRLLAKYSENGQTDKMLDIMKQVRSTKSESGSDFEVTITMLAQGMRERFREKTDHDYLMKFPFQELRKEEPYLFIDCLQHLLSNLLEKQKYDEMIEVLNYFEKNPNLIANQAIMDVIRDINPYMFKIAKIPERDVYESVATAFVNMIEAINFKKLSHEFGPSKSEEFGIMQRINAKDIEGAIEEFERITKTRKSLHFLPQLTKEVVMAEDQEKLQRILDACLEIRGEESVLYDFSRIFIEMGKLAPAKKLMKTPGLRYVDSIAENVCKKLKDKPAGLKEFVNLCKPLAFSNLSYLNDVLIDAFENDPNEIQDLWIQMQEEAYLPTDDQLAKMARILKKHGMEVPFDVSEAMEPPKKKSPPIQESKPPKKEVPEKPNSDLDKLTTIDLAMKELVKCSNDKKISVGLIGRVIKLMKDQSDFGRFEELCGIMGQNVAIINSRFYPVLDKEFSLQDVASINLSDETKSKCRWDGFIMRKGMTIENFDEFYTFINQNAKIQNVRWYGVLKKKPEYAPRLQEEIQKLNDSEVSSHFILACINADQLDIAKDLLQTRSIDPTIFSNWCSSINVEEQKRALDFGKDNFPAELQNELQQAKPYQGRK